MAGFIRWLSIVAVCGVMVSGQTPRGKTLDVYVVDVEGGGATLFVSPSGEAVLIDTGNGGPAAARDSGRILAAVKDAGLTQIDHLITTHWHGDHYGSMPELSSQIPIRHYIDHGPTVESGNAAADFVQKTYPSVFAKAKRTIVKAGDTVPVAGLNWRIVMAAGQAIKTALPGAGQPNPYCATTKRMDDDKSDNAQSVGSVITFGRFRTVHLGDLTWNKELDLMCPANRIGHVDLFVVSHHGLNISNSEVLVHAIEPRVAVMNNGSRKGGQPETMRIIHSAPGLENLWQLYFSVLSGQENTVPGMFIANTFDEPLTAMPIAATPAPQPGSGAPPPPAHQGQAYWIKVSAQAGGSFSVTNARNGFTKTYKRVPSADRFGDDRRESGSILVDPHQRGPFGHSDRTVPFSPANPRRRSWADTAQILRLPETVAPPS